MLNIGTVVALIKTLAPAADPATIESAVTDWLDEHPEATTTVTDGSITEQKLATALATKVASISSLSDEIADITGCEEISFTSGAIIATNGSTYDVSAPITLATYSYAVCDATPGEQFTIRGQGAGTGLLWAFGDGATSGNVIAKSMSNAKESDFVVITAPTNSTKLIVNSLTSVTPKLYRGAINTLRLDGIDANVAKIDGNVDYYRYANLFVWANRKTGLKLNLTTGRVSANQNAITSDFIKVEPNTLYTDFNNVGICEYTTDDENSFVRLTYPTQVSGANNAYTFTTGGTTNYIRTEVQSAYETNGFFIVPGGANYGIEVREGINKILIDDKAKISPFTINALTDVDGLPLANNYDETVAGTSESVIIAADGSIGSGSGTSITGFIPVKPSTVYNVGGFYFGNDNYAFYDKNKGVLYDAHVKTNTDPYNGTITSPANARYIRLTYTTGAMNKFISEIYSEYKEYGLNFDSQSYPWQGKKVLVLGDSISDNNYHWGSTEWNKWPYVLQQRKKFILTNDSVLATGFLAIPNVEGTTSQPLINRIDNYTEDDFDMVILFMGINDYNRQVPLGESIGNDKTANFKSAVDYCLKHVLTYQPSARFVGLLPLPTLNVVGMDNYTQFLYDRYRYYSIPVLNLRQGSGFHPTVEEFRNLFTEIGGTQESHAPDGVHPNQAWDNNYLAPMIGNFMDRFLF